MTDYEEIEPGGIGFERVATVVCRICEDTDSEYFCGLFLAAVRFEQQGWEEIDGKWHCKECAETVKGQQ